MAPLRCRPRPSRETRCVSSSAGLYLMRSSRRAEEVRVCTQCRRGRGGATHAGAHAVGCSCLFKSWKWTRHDCQLPLTTHLQVSCIIHHYALWNWKNLQNKLLIKSLFCKFFQSDRQISNIYFICRDFLLIRFKARNINCSESFFLSSFFFLRK